MYKTVKQNVKKQQDNLVTYCCDKRFILVAFTEEICLLVLALLSLYNHVIERHQT